ncbi:hypothetical protein NDU88_007626, partial [Pleurodeles waltl]
VNLGRHSTGRRTTGRSGAEEKTPERGNNQRRLTNNFSDIQEEEQEAARPADRPRSGESVAPSGTVL